MFRIYDKPNTFFFLDSPYRNTESYRVGKFTDEQYYLLADCCKKAKGQWLYTINDDELIRELFKDFNTTMKYFTLLAGHLTDGESMASLLQTTIQSLPVREGEWHGKRGNPG